MSDATLAAHAPAAPPANLNDGGGDTFADELFHLPVAARYAASLFMVGLATAVALAVEQLAAPSNVALFFVVPVVLAAAAFGWGPSLAAVIAGVLAFDFFFTEPKYSFEIANPSDIWAAGLLLVTAAIVSAVAADARRRAADARHDATVSEALRALAHIVVEGRPPADILQASAATLSRIFLAPAIVFAQDASSLTVVAASDGPTITPAEESAAREALASRGPVRAETYPCPRSMFDFWPLTTVSGRDCVLGVDFKRAGRRRPRAPERYVDVVAAYVAVALTSRP